MRGIILRQDGATLVVQPTDQEVERFAAGAPVTVARPTSAAHVDWGEVSRHGYLYDQHGRQVCAIRELTSSVDVLDTTTFGSVTSRFLTGARDVTIRAVGLPEGLPWP